MPSEYEIQAPLQSNVGSSQPTGLDALFQSSGIMGAVAQRISRLFTPTLTMGIVNSSTSSVKSAPVLIDATLINGKHALNVSPVQGANAVIPQAESSATLGATAKILTGAATNTMVILTNTDSTNAGTFAFVTSGGAAPTNAANTGVVLYPRGVMVLENFTGDIYGAANSGTPVIALQVFRSA